MSKTTIVIADDQPLIRDGLAAILSMQEEYAVVAKAEDGGAAVRRVQAHRPQLVLMDVHMPKLDGLQATRQIKAEFPDTRILILTTFEDEEYIWEAIRSGASGYIVKGTDTEKILSTIRDCLDGRMNYPLSIQSRLLQAIGALEPQGQGTGALATEEAASAAVSAAEHEDKLSGLTLQERNILHSLKQGKSNQTIADELFLSSGTVKNYLYSIYKKMGVSSRAEAIAFLHRHDR